MCLNIEYFFASAVLDNDKEYTEYIMGNIISVKTVSYGVSECDPIELYYSDDGTRRLVFLPIIHDNEKKNGLVDGVFIYQRKSKTNEWERIANEEESLSKLKSGEGYRLKLSSDSVTKLVDGLLAIEDIAERVKNGKTNTTYVPTSNEIAPLLKQLFDSNDDDTVTRELLRLGSENALRLNDLVLNARVRSALAYWEDHKEDSDEESWQVFFGDRPWILALMCAEPIIILKEKMYVGGTNASRKGGKNVDFAFINKQTNNTALLEIKTPTTPLLGAEYRGMYPLSQDANGSITQVQNYKYSVLKDLRALKEGYGDFDAVNIPTYVLLGDTKQLDDVYKRRSFELSRKNSKDTFVMTYDEIFERLKILIS